MQAYGASGRSHSNHGLVLKTDISTTSVGNSAHGRNILGLTNNTTTRSYLHQKQHELNNDAQLIKNRVGKLRQIENKMLKKIDKTRLEAEKVRMVKAKNEGRL